MPEYSSRIGWATEFWGRDALRLKHAPQTQTLINGYYPKGTAFGGLTLARNTYITNKNELLYNYNSFENTNGIGVMGRLTTPFITNITKTQTISTPPNLPSTYSITSRTPLFVGDFINLTNIIIDAQGIYNESWGLWNITVQVGQKLPEAVSLPPTVNIYYQKQETLMSDIKDALEKTKGALSSIDFILRTIPTAPGAPLAPLGIPLELSKINGAIEAVGTAIDGLKESEHEYV